VLGMVLAESILLLLLGGLIGLALVSVLTPIVGAASGGVLNLPRVGAGSWTLGIALALVIGLVIGALPAMRAMRLNIVDALAGR
jgi:putative ABC transport system permease protein